MLKSARSVLAAAASLALGCASLPGAPSALRGWELNEGNTGLAGVGVVKEKLSAYRGPAKPAAGARISEMRIDAPLDLSAGGIVIERCWIRPLVISRGNHILTTYDNNRNAAPVRTMVTVKDCDIDGTALSAYDVCGACAFSGGGTVLRCNIYGVGSGIAIWHVDPGMEVLVEGNYIHGLRAWGDSRTNGSHNDGFTIRDYAGPSAVVRNNRIDCSSGNDTGAFFLQPFSGPIDNVTVEGNLLEGAGYQMQLGRQNFDYGRNMRASDNRFSGTGFGSGYVDRKGLPYGWAEWTDNYLNDPRMPGNKGAPVRM
jgi:hypothetical protein